MAKNSESWNRLSRDQKILAKIITEYPADAEGNASIPIEELQKIFDAKVIEYEGLEEIEEPA